MFCKCFDTLSKVFSLSNRSGKLNELIRLISNYVFGSRHVTSHFVACFQLAAVIYQNRIIFIDIVIY